MFTVVFTYLLVVGVVNEGRIAGLPLNHVKDESSSLLVSQVVMSLVLLWLLFKVIIFQLFILHVFKPVVDVFTSDTETNLIGQIYREQRLTSRGGLHPLRDPLNHKLPSSSANKKISNVSNKA